MSIKNYFVLCSTLLLIYSCAKDNPSGHSPISIIGTWTSEALSYHEVESCLDGGQSLESFVNTAITNNIEIEAQNTASLVCLDEAEYESCLTEFVELYSNNFNAADSLIFNMLISDAFYYNNMTLIINEGTSYETEYDGTCHNANSLSSEFCDIIDGAEWNLDLETCELLTETACEGAEGYWDDGWVGDWEENGGNYTLYNFPDHTNEGETTTKTLVFDGNNLFIVLSVEDEQCLCDPDYFQSSPFDTSADCVDTDHCIWLDSYCVSLNFSN